MLRREFFRIAGTAVAGLASQGRVSAQKQGGFPNVRNAKVYGTEATLAVTPEFSKKNLGKWAGVNVVLATDRDLVFDGGEPVRFNEEFLNVIAGLGINPEKLLENKTWRRGDRNIADVPSDILKRISTKRYSVAGTFSCKNLADQNPRHWDTALICGADLHFDVKKTFARMVGVPAEVLNMPGTGELWANQVLAHEAWHVYLYINGLLQSKREASLRALDNLKSVRDEKDLEKLQQILERAALENDSINNQNEYSCDQFGVNQCLLAGMTSEEAAAFRNARAIGGLRQVHHVTAPQMNIEGNEADPVLLASVPLSPQDPLLAATIIDLRLRLYLINELNVKGPDLLHQEINNIQKLYVHLQEMLEANKFESALEVQIVTQFLNACRALVPSYFNAPDARAGNDRSLQHMYV